MAIDLRSHQRYRHLPPDRLVQIQGITARLRRVELFETLSEQELAYIAETGRLEKHDCGAVIIHKGDVDKTFYVVVRGQVRVWEKDADGVPRLLN